MVKPSPCKFGGTQTQAKGGEDWPFQKGGRGVAPQTREGKSALEK